MVNKTMPTDVSPRCYIEGLSHARRKLESEVLLELFIDVTGYNPVMWGPSIIGFGRYEYLYESGRGGETFATGFAPRASSFSIYIMPGYHDYSAILARLGKHRMGRSCLYVNKVADIDLNVLRELIEAGLWDLDKIWPVHAR